MALSHLITKGLVISYGEGGGATKQEGGGGGGCKSSFITKKRVGAEKDFAMLMCVCVCGGGGEGARSFGVDLI